MTVKSMDNLNTFTAFILIQADIMVIMVITVTIVTTKIPYYLNCYCGNLIKK